MFKVIGGGAGGSQPPGAAPESWRKKLRQLHHIEAILYRRQKSKSGPRASRAMLAAGATCVGMLAAIFGLEHAGMPVSAIPWKLARQAVALAPYFVAFGIFLLVLARSSVPKTWTGLLDQLLVQYNPLDKEAYRRLQQHTRERDHLDTDQVVEWIQAEREAVKASAGWNKPEKYDGSFVNKKI